VFVNSPAQSVGQMYRAQILRAGLRRARRCAGGERFLARGFEIFLLADIADYGDDFATVILLTRMMMEVSSSSGLGEDNFFRFMSIPFTIPLLV